MLIEANGIRINYELLRKTDAPVVMLSHSLACSMGMWNPQLDVLHPHFPVLRYDMRGHGESEAPEGAYTLDQLAADAIGLLDALQIDTVHFVGLSIGGMIGQCLALNYADRLQSLTLCDTAPLIPDEAKTAFFTNACMQLARKECTPWFREPSNAGLRSPIAHKILLKSTVFAIRFRPHPSPGTLGAVKPSWGSITWTGFRKYSSPR